MNRYIIFFLVLLNLFIEIPYSFSQKKTSYITKDKKEDNHSFVLKEDETFFKELIKKPQAIANLDQFLNNCIAQRVFPGCQVFAAKDGKVIYNKNWGSLTYDKSLKVKDSTLYDIASVTKIAATTLAIMKLYEEGKISLTAYIKAYLPFVEGTDKANLTIKDLLTHEAGLKSWIPFYKKTINPTTGLPDKRWFTTNKTDDYFPIPVAANFNMSTSYLDTVWNEILSSTLATKGRYVYSDLDFYFLEEIVSAVTGEKLDVYCQKHFFDPLGLKRIMYNPWKLGLQQTCAPTEKDQVFRLQLIQGYVHDPGAAMSGGVAGHAGLFSNAYDLAVIMQMLNNEGVYNGKRFFKKETVQLFTSYRSAGSRRGFGFDKPEKRTGDGTPASDLCSKATFGHQGFTGTCAWADPTTGIIFVFLSNRVYPSADNKLINSLNVRSKAQDFIYEALGYGTK